MTETERADKAERERDEARLDALYHSDCRPNRRQAEAAIADAKAMNDKWADEVKARREAELAVGTLQTALRQQIESGHFHSDRCYAMGAGDTEALICRWRSEGGMFGRREAAEELAKVCSPVRAFPFDAWHEDDHDVLWWRFPIQEPPYVGSPLCSDWPFEVGDEGALGWTRLVVPDPAALLPALEPTP